MSRYRDLLDASSTMLTPRFSNKMQPPTLLDNMLGSAPECIPVTEPVSCLHRAVGKYITFSTIPSLHSAKASPTGQSGHFVGVYMECVWPGERALQQQARHVVPRKKQIQRGTRAR